MTTTTTNTEGAFTGGDSLRLYRQSWLPDGAPRAAVAIVHGYAEHSERYTWVGTQLAQAGIAVHGYDLRGHGYSEGPRVLVKSFNEHLNDLAEFLDVVRAESPGIPLFLLGHSMGGCIAALYVAVRQPELAGLILSGPAVNPPGRALRVVGKLISGIARVRPGLGVRTLSAAAVSRDPEVVEKYELDPQVYRGKIPAATVAAIGRAIDRIDLDAHNIRLPILFIHGTADELCDVAGSQRLFEQISSSDKTLKTYDGLFHEVLNEPEKEQVLGDVREWIEARIGRPAGGTG